jgi:hypothetical protein
LVNLFSLCLFRTLYLCVESMTLQSLISPTKSFNLAGCLHTDILESEYGPIRVRLLHHDQDFRVVHLIDQQGVSRTFAITFFPPQGHSPSIAEVNRKIKNGNPLGKAFRDGGYEVRKNVLKVLIMKKPEWLTTAFRDQTPFAKARISEFLARKASGQIEFYGTVLEIYPNAFRTSEISSFDQLQEAPTVKNLLKHGFQIDQIWNCLLNTQPHLREQISYVKALQESQENILDLSQKIHQVLSQNWG